MISDRLNNLGYWSFEAASKAPDAIAIIDLSSVTPREVLYGELEQRLDRFAALLDAHGLKPGDRMAMSIGNRFEFVEIMFGAMRAGVVPVPLNTKLGRDTLDYIIKDAACVAAVVDPAVNPHVADLAEGAGCRLKLVVSDQRVGWLDYEATLLATRATFNPPRIADDHPSFQPYTSGSTGRPKGVVLTHAGQLWWVRAVQRYWPSSASDRALTAVPLYHKNAMAGAIKPMLHCGGSVVLLPNFEPRRFLKTLADYRCTSSGGVPAVFTLLLQEKDLIGSLDFSALKGLKIGSAPTPKELMDAVERAFGVTVRESYGLTEGGPVMIGAPLDGRDVPHGSCGVAWPEGEVKLVGADGKVASYGELWVKNPGVTPGYHNLPKVNAERIEDGWLKTGDLFSKDDQGFFYFRGRTDDMFSSGGENIYPLEVENLLLKHPMVAEASVVPLPHPVKGEVPVAMVVLTRGGEGVTEDELKTFCLAHGPAYAHPRRIVFVGSLPLNGPGKIDRKIVTERMREAVGAEAGSP